MDMQWMKRIDRLLGVPLCAALKAYDTVLGGKRVSPEEALSHPRGQKQRIAVIKFWGMGSLILATPLFHALRESHPEAEVHLVTLGQNRGIISRLEIADNVHFLEIAEGGSALSVAGGILRFFAGLHSLKFDAVIDLEYLSRFSAIAGYLTGAPVRVGFHSWDVWRGNLQTERRAFNPYWHATENFLNLHRALGKDGGTHPISIKLKGDEKERAAKLLKEAGVGEGDRVIAVNANASTIALARRWPEESFVTLMDMMVDAGLGRVVLLGAPDEADYIAGLHKRLKQPELVVSIAGKSSLDDLVGVLMRADLLVTNDSGPLHLAAALGTKTVSFFGPETPQLFGPVGDGHEVLYRGIDCSPCINIYNAKTVRCMRAAPECLTGISASDAFDAVNKLLEEPN